MSAAIVVFGTKMTRARSYLDKHKYWYTSSLSLTLLFGLIFFYALNLFVYNYSVNNFHAIDKACATLLLASFGLWGAQCVGYIDHLLKSVLIYKTPEERGQVRCVSGQPAVGIFIPVFNENPNLVKEIVLNTLNIEYSNFELYLLDDSNDLRICAKLRDLANELNFNYVRRNNRRGHKAGAINDAIKKLDGAVKYLLILDVDHCPTANILADLVPLLEDDEQVSFVQTPQYFSNHAVEKIPLAYSFQQHVFHKHVCRGLDVNGAMFMCGTNLLIRVDQLKEIGGMDETCITEDIATSFLLHSRGYKSLYVDKVYAEGISPQTLAAYFTQQMRWAYGTIQNCKRCASLLFRSPKRLYVAQWWEYLIINGLWYFSGLTFFVWIIYTISVLLFNVRPIIFVPFDLPFLIFIVMVGSQLLTSIHERAYRLRDLFLAQGLYYNLFPIFIRAMLYSLLGKQIDFVVTPKGGTQLIPLKKLWPHISILAVLLLATSSGVWKVTTGQFSLQYLHVLGWAIYNIVMLSSIFYFYIRDRHRNSEVEAP